MHRGGVVALTVMVALLVSPAATGLVGAEATTSAHAAAPPAALPDSGTGHPLAWSTGGHAAESVTGGPVPGSMDGPAAPRPNETELTMVLDVRANGNVRWTVTTYVELSSENDTKAFREQARRWRNGNLDVGYDVHLFRKFARAASNATGREMGIPRPVERTAELVDNGSRGAFRLSFTWTNFARREDQELVLDDAFQTASGTWLTGLDSGQTLIVRPPAEFTFESHPEGARLDNQSLIWEGPETFPDSYFTRQPVVFVTDDPPRSPTPTGPPGSPTPGTSTGTTVPPPDQGSPDGLLLGVVAALLLGGGLAVYRRYGGERGPTGTPASAGATDGGDGSGGGVAAEDASQDEGAAPDVGPDAETAAEPEPTPQDPFAGVDPDLLSDEEQVLRLLEANGGRMKQATIVTETGWSNAKVSQLLSAMDEDEEIDKLRIGRENLISLPDVEVGEVE